MLDTYVTYGKWLNRNNARCIACCNTDARRTDNVSRNLASCSAERKCINIDIDTGSATIFCAAIVYHSGQGNIYVGSDFKRKY